MMSLLDRCSLKTVFKIIVLKQKIYLYVSKIEKNVMALL